MFAQDKEIVFAIVSSSLLMLFLVGIIVAAIVKYQSRARKHIQEMDNLKISYQEETIKAQLEKEEQTLTRISQELHDNIGQILSLVKLNLNTLDAENCSPETARKVYTTRDLVGKAISDLRELSKSLNAMHVFKNSLSETINYELELINRSGTYLTHLDVSGDELPFDPQKQLIIFRIVQEALNNIIKHANARNINIGLHYSNNSLELAIADNGAGFHVQKPDGEGSGLGNIYHRANLIHAEITIKSTKGEGTTILLNIPTDK